MRNIKLVVEYDGSMYHGWQYQENALAIQQVLSQAIKKLTGEDILPDGAGRTDTGVHALGQVATFKTESTVPADKFAVALNTYLPGDISIASSEEVMPDFHARFSSVGKHYRYQVFNRTRRSALYHNRAWHVREKLDVKKMNECAQLLVGKHNFKAFCAAGATVKTFERELYSACWTQSGDELLVFDTTGSGYLYNMVRIIVGTLVEVGKGRLTGDCIREALSTENRNVLGMTAPPQGLYLTEVFY